MTLAKFGIHLELKVLLSLFSTECDSYTGREFFHDGQPAPFIPQDNFDSSEVQAAIVTNLRENVSSERQAEFNIERLDQSQYANNDAFLIACNYSHPQRASDSVADGFNRMPSLGDVSLPRNFQQYRDNGPYSEQQPMPSTIIPPINPFSIGNTKSAAPSDMMSSEDFGGMKNGQNLFKFSNTIPNHTNAHLGPRNICNSGQGCGSDNLAPPTTYVDGGHAFPMGYCTQLGHNNSTTLGPNVPYMLMLTNSHTYTNSANGIIDSNWNNCIPAFSQSNNVNNLPVNPMTKLTASFPYNDSNGLNLPQVMMYQQQIQHAVASNGIGGTAKSSGFPTTFSCGNNDGLNNSNINYTQNLKETAIHLPFTNSNGSKHLQYPTAISIQTQAMSCSPRNHPQISESNQQLPMKRSGGSFYTKIYDESWSKFTSNPDYSTDEQK